MFDFLQYRTEPEYAPTVLYDAACLFKEFSLNRETRRAIQSLERWYIWLYAIGLIIENKFMLHKLFRDINN